MAWRRAVLFGVALAAVVSTVGPGAAGKHRRMERVTEKEYLPPVSVSAFTIDLYVSGQRFGGASFLTGPGDRYVNVEVFDDSGLPAGGVIYQGNQLLPHDFCGSTEKPIRIREGSELHVSLYQGPCSETGTPALATTGKIRATFSNLP